MLATPSPANSPAEQQGSDLVAETDDEQADADHEDGDECAWPR